MAHEGYEFDGGYPGPETVARVYDEIDLARAVSAYRLFYPTVSGLAIFKGNNAIGVLENRVFGTLQTEPKHVGFTLNSDTPYAPLLLDLRDGPLVIELPPGPLICIAMDLNQRWVLDMGLPGPDAGQGGRHLLLPPGYDGDIPQGYYVGRSTTYRVLGGIRSLPVGGDVPGALERLTTVTVRPLDPAREFPTPTWLDLTPGPQDSTPLAWENNLGYWRALHEAIDSEPALPEFHVAYGDLAALGIAAGRPFEPDARMTEILERAALIGNAQLRVQSFADRRPDRVVWPDRQWEWAALRFENGDFEQPDRLDVEAREKWFYQAIGASPAMFRRDTKAGSLYWLGQRDAAGAYLEGGRTYRLTVPQPVPGSLFWSVTVYDARTRSQIRTDQDKAVLSSLFDFHDSTGSDPIDLYFGPTAPADAGNRWIQTLPGTGWFVYFRIYGPQAPAFDGSWKPGDFEQT
ncbi:DUF1254 domain-containing protein [Nocardia jejuensis]|uniref:DUF1254 domain-containing protein n=1 Tax=Nocardia jejuensis TaxID=328049 RepID=UPI000B3391D8|nr:DUF1254 domain-containing protein [Nocardia jejuensis]